MYGFIHQLIIQKYFYNILFVKDNINNGIKTDNYGSHVNLNSSMVTGNGNYGIESNGQVNTNYSNITFNNNDGIYLTGNNFQNIRTQSFEVMMYVIIHKYILHLELPLLLILPYTRKQQVHMVHRVLSITMVMEVLTMILFLQIQINT